jgi:hypothetical protein
VRTGGLSRVLLFALPLALLLAAVILGVEHGHQGAPASPDRPLALPPIEAPDASSQACSALLSALPDRLPATPGTLPRKAIAEPRPPGTMAWAESKRPGDPVVLRCGLAKPAELGPGAAELDVNGVRWLTVSESGRDSFFTVGRQVVVALTVPRGLGGGPVQAVSDVVRTAVSAG